MNTIGPDASRHELVYCLDEYDEVLSMMKILQEGLEDIANDTMSEGKMVETAIETLQSIEDKCKQSNWRTTNLIPEKLWEMD